jgi:hypothetical protein
MWRLHQNLRKLWAGFILGCLGLFLVNECLFGWLFTAEGCVLNQAVRDDLPTYGPWVLALILLLVGLTFWARRGHRA